MTLAMGISDTTTPPQPIYLVARPGLARDRVRAALGDAELVESSPDALRERGPEPAIVLLVVGALDEAELLDVLQFAAAPERAWIPVLVDADDPTPIASVLSMAAVDLETIVRHAASGGQDATLPEIRSVLRRGSKARHDLNNPLTSALAEVQLLLLDVEDPVLRPALETIQTQLLRLRDTVTLVPSLRELRRKRE